MELIERAQSKEVSSVLLADREYLSATSAKTQHMCKSVKWFALWEVVKMASLPLLLISALIPHPNDWMRAVVFMFACFGMWGLGMIHFHSLYRDSCEVIRQSASARLADADMRV
jgi:hypothetical protein